ncbi:MAG: YceI family protein [Pyrinomonadaceae bacterium]
MKRWLAEGSSHICMDEDGNHLVHYRLVADQSRFSVQAFAEGLFSAFGHDPVIVIRDFTGEAGLEPDTLSQAQLRLKINAASLAASEEVKEKDRPEIDRMMRDEVLETAQYPEIVFESTNISPSRLKPGRYRARIIGNLTLHGVTHNNLWVYAEVSLDGESLRAQGECTLKQTDYNIKLVSVAGGTLKVKNEVKLSFDIKGQRAEG